MSGKKLNLDDVSKLIEECDEVVRSSPYSDQINTFENLREVVNCLKAFGYEWGSEELTFTEYYPLLKHTCLEVSKGRPSRFSQTKNYTFDDNKYYVVWSRYGECLYEDMKKIGVYHIMKEKLMEYNPLEIDEFGSCYIYSVTDGKRLAEDYDKIIKSMKKIIEAKKEDIHVRENFFSQRKIVSNKEERLLLEQKGWKIEPTHIQHEMLYFNAKNEYNPALPEMTGQFLIIKQFDVPDDKRENMLIGCSRLDGIDMYESTEYVSNYRDMFNGIDKACKKYSKEHDLESKVKESIKNNETHMNIHKRPRRSR